MMAQITRSRGGAAMTTLQRAEAAEHALSQELDRVVVKSVLFTSGERDPRQPVPRPPDDGRLYIGHSERVGYGVAGLASDGLTIYRRTGGRQG